MNLKHKLSVKAGIPGVTTRVVYDYRGHFITRRMRTYDSRNKTHNGYWYDVDFFDGGGVAMRPTLKDAKSVIDRYADHRAEVAV